MIEAARVLGLGSKASLESTFGDFQKNGLLGWATGKEEGRAAGAGRDESLGR
jgi:hypothetical protein